MGISIWSCDDTVSPSLSFEIHVFDSHFPVLTYDELCLLGHFPSSPWRRQQHHCSVVLAWLGLRWSLLHSSVSTSADHWIRQQRREQNKTREVTYTTAQREKGRGKGEREMKTTTPSAWGHWDHVSQTGNDSKGTFLEVAGQGELLFDYFNSARLPPSVGSLKDIILFQ